MGLLTKMNNMGYDAFSNIEGFMTRAEFEKQVKAALEFYEKAGIVLSEEEKNEISHRGKALKAVLNYLKNV